MKGVGKDLDRDVAMQPGVPCAIDLTHAAGAERAGDFVLPEARPVLSGICCRDAGL